MNPILKLYERESPLKKVITTVESITAQTVDSGKKILSLISAIAPAP